MLESLRSLRLEVDSLLEALRESRGTLVTSASARQRVQQLYLSWSSLRSQLLPLRLPEPLLRRTDNLVEYAVRLAGGRRPKGDYVRRLRDLRQVLAKDLLLEIARAGQPPVGFAPTPVERAALPQIPGLTVDLLPNALYGWATVMQKFLQANNYDHNVFVMVAYRSSLKKFIEDIKSVITDLGLNPVVARDHNLTDDLYNPLACLLCCRYGVAIFDRGESKQLHNANIVYELAMMQTLKRPCLILKHETVKSMPSDFLHKLYESYGSKQQATRALRNWWKRLQARS